MSPENALSRKLDMQAFWTSSHSTTAVKAIWKLPRPLYSPLNRHFSSPNLCHAHRFTIVKLLKKQDWEDLFVFLFHIVANKMPHLHYTSLYQLLVFTNIFATTRQLRYYINRVCKLKNWYIQNNLQSIVMCKGRSNQEKTNVVANYEHSL